MYTLSSTYNRAFVGECVFGSAEDKRPVLATDGLNSCIGFAGWNRDTQIGFLVHFYGPAQVEDFYSNGVRILSKLTHGKKCEFQCVIKGGCIKTSASKKMIDAIKSWKGSKSSIAFEIIKEEEMSLKIGILKTLSLDTRTGEVGEYDMSKDPDPMEMSQKSENREITFDIAEKLIYNLNSEI